MVIGTLGVDGLGCYIRYSEEGPGLAAASASPLLTVPNVTAHPSTASVPASHSSMWHYNCRCALKGSLVNSSETAGEELF